MALTKQQQFDRLLNSSERILIMLPENPHGDAIGAGFGLAHILTMLNFTPTVVFSDPSHKANLYTFLPQPHRVIDSLSGSRDFILSFKTAHNDIIDVHTERTDDALHVHVTPEHGMIDTRDFSFGLDTFPYDLMITIGLANKESAGAIYADVPDIFYAIPIVNIDNSSTNENFGQINIVTLTTSSVTEVVLDLCHALAHKRMTPDAAQCFLTGIITATDSFRAPRTTPAALSYAGDMIDQGADQQEIITHLYKSQPLSLVQLWGRTLSKLQKSDDGEMITSTLTQSDFDETGAGTHYLPAMIDKIKQSYATGKVFVIIHEDHGTIKALIDTSRTGDIAAELTTPDGDPNLHDTVVQAATVEDAREKILGMLSQRYATDKTTS